MTTQTQGDSQTYMGILIALPRCCRGFTVLTFFSFERQANTRTAGCRRWQPTSEFNVVRRAELDTLVVRVDIPADKGLREAIRDRSGCGS